ncbi:uncharacterized protein LOC125946642 [Dermacentor silvarum]|uniref:uncharacterized protein LOC125946642 n=1 Tax=Dermacentor silvarum TaxID=543639 RepID=UPI0021018585|nr:uncharacterized protein LOC125946642 [Dermacentor silvarum]
MHALTVKMLALLLIQIFCIMGTMGVHGSNSTESSECLNRTTGVTVSSTRESSTCLHLSPFCTNPFDDLLSNPCGHDNEKRYMYDAAKGKCKRIFGIPCNDRISTYLKLRYCLLTCPLDSPCIKEPENGTGQGISYYFDKQEGTCYSQKQGYTDYEKRKEPFS